MTQSGRLREPGRFAGAGVAACMGSLCLLIILFGVTRHVAQQRLRHVSTPSSIMSWSAIFGQSAKAETAAPASAPSASTAPQASPAPSGTMTRTGPAPEGPKVEWSAPVEAPVDVKAILLGLAKSKKQKLKYDKSIVDLLKLLELDSSLTARQELAKELGYSGNTKGSSKMNVWLHKEVMRQLAANGGKVPKTWMA